MKKFLTKTLALAAMLMLSVSAMAIDWSGIDYLGDGAGGGTYSNKYKFYTEETGVAVVNIQRPGFATADGFYITLPDAAFNAIEENGSALVYDTQGAGICLHVANFTNKETECVVKNNDATRWTFYIYYEDGVEFVNTPSEYCEYTDDNLKSNNANITLTWGTNNHGDVVITMENGSGATSCSFRNGGFEGGIDAFVVSIDDFVTTTLASNYFTFEKVYSGNTATLVRTAPLPSGAKIKHIGSGHALAWKVNGADAWSFPDFIYTYGANCPVTEDTQAPTDFTAVVKETSYTSVTLTLQATDDKSAKIYYTVTDQNENEYQFTGTNGAAMDCKITGLSLNTTYTFSVVAADKAGNVTDPISNIQATTLVGPDAKTYFGIQTGTAAKAVIGGETKENVPYEIYYAITRNSDFTLSCTAFLAGEYANATSLANGSVGYRGSTDWADFTKNPDGTRTRQTSRDTYEAFEGQGITCMFHFPAQEALINPYFNGYVVGAESAPYTRKNLTVGNFGTLALPFDATVAGADLYEVTAVGSESITLSPVEGNIAEAGKGYVFKATATTLTATYTAVAALASSNYMISNYTDATVQVEGAESKNIYILSANELHKVNSGITVNVGEHRAYFNLPDLSAAPARIALVTDESQVVTGVANMAEETNANKMIVNGKVVILKNGVQYNALGQIIK